MIWRDDDVLMKPHDLVHLLVVDDLLKRHGQLHTVAIIGETLTPDLGAIIRERGMSAQVHCWSHDDLSVNAEAVADLPLAVGAIEHMVGARPTVLYPPWNRTSPMLEEAAAALGLTVSAEKISLDQFVRCGGDVAEGVCNFHFWHAPERALLKLALRIAARADESRVVASSSAVRVDSQ